MRTSWARLLVAATATVLALAAVIAAGCGQYVSDLRSEGDARAGSGGSVAADETTTTTAPPVTVPETGVGNATTTEREASTTEEFIEGVGRLQDSDAADPFVVMEGRQMWLFTTNNEAGNVPVVKSVGGGVGPLTRSDALPTLAAWATEGNTWAPAVTRTDDGWVLAFTARHIDSSRQCIGVATADSVSGPYTAPPEPLACDTDRGGSIDPSFVSDDAGHLWLLYKDDGNCCGLPTYINAVALTSDATALAGSPVPLIGADLAWEGGLVEAPTMTQMGDRWLLLYSANRWETEDYTMGAAWCDSPTGPCEKQAEPVLPTRSGIEGPGGVEFASGVRAGTQLVTFHAWPKDQVGDASAQRRLQVGRATYDPTTDTVTVTAFTPE